MPRIEDYDYCLPPELVAQYPSGRAGRLPAVGAPAGRGRDSPCRLPGAARLAGRKRRPGGQRHPGFSGASVGPQRQRRQGGAAAPPPAGGRWERAARARATHRGRLKVGPGPAFRGGTDRYGPGPGPAGGGGSALHRCPAATPSARSWRRGKCPCRPILTVRPKRVTVRPIKRSSPPAAGAVACPTAGTPLHGNGIARPGPPGGRDRAPHPARGAGDVHAGAPRRTIPGTGCCRNTLSYPRPRRTASTPPERRENAWWRWAPPASGCWSSAPRPGGFTAQQGWCDLYIYPGYRFRAVDRMLTNFHLPKSTLLLLVSAFAGRDLISAGLRGGYSRTLPVL